MLVNLSLNDFVEYTDWERYKWYDWLRQHGEHVLKIGTGSHGDGRFETVGDVVKHIFSAEKRYVDRLSGRQLTDTSSVSNHDIEGLFQFAEESRKDLKDLVETFPTQEWDIPKDFKILDYLLRATPRKIVVHVLMHEIRHWAQIATLLRLNGLAGEFHDFLFSPVMGGEFRREDAT